MPHKAPVLAPDWMKVTEAAQRLGIHPRTVRAMVRNGRLDVRAIQFDSFMRINRKDFERELARRTAVGLSA